MVHLRATKPASLSASESSVGARVFYFIGIAGCLISGFVLLGRIIAALDLWMVLPATAALIAGVALADLITGVVHWACDSWGSEKTRWLGANLIYSFREHHHKPKAMLDHDWVDVNGGAAIAAFLGFLGFDYFIVGAGLASAGRGVVIASFFLGLVTTSAIANQLHYWAHTRGVPRVIAFLQKRDLILSRAQHAGHHRAPHMRGYCISTGWLNRPLDAIGFWRALEVAVGRLTGTQPRKDQEARRVAP